MEVFVPPSPLVDGFELPQPPSELMARTHAKIRARLCSSLRLRLRPTRKSAVASDSAGHTNFCCGARLEEVADEAMVNVDVAAVELGVTVAGEKMQVAPAGWPEQVKEIAALNPLSGVTVTAVVPLFPAVRVSEAGERERLKSVAGRVMVYVAVATPLSAYPLTTAIALMVVVALIVRAAV